MFFVVLQVVALLAELMMVEDCCFCHSLPADMKEPRVLPCSHIVCTPCLKKNFTESVGRTARCTCG